jgi:uncharacterized membrane protein
MSHKGIPMSLQLATTAINAALYALVGVISAPIPTVFGVRFWPPVFIPAVFSLLFGPWTGGVGAAIGIFLSDVFYGHHDALLSLLVGVPSNFLGFYVLGWLSENMPRGVGKHFLTLLGLLVSPLIVAVYFASIYIALGWKGFGLPEYVYLAVGIVVVAVVLITIIRHSLWANFGIASSIGLALGSLIIGVGLVAYSRLFTLPAVVGTSPLNIDVIYGATAFTYFSEILFILFLAPPIVAAGRAVFPSLRPDSLSSAPHTTKQALTG